MLVSDVSRTTTVIALSHSKGFCGSPVVDSFAEFPSNHHRVHRTGIQRHSDHRARNAAMLERAEVLDRRHASRCEHGKVRALRNVFHERKIGTSQLTLL